MPSITRTQNRYVLLAPTSLAVQAAKTISALSRSTVTATATSTAHGYSTGDVVIILGADKPQYNGVFTITVVDANTFTYTMETDPGATAGGTITAQKGLAATYLWGDGTGTTRGNLPTATGGVVLARWTNGASAPTTPVNISLWTSDTGAAGTWREAQTSAGGIGAAGAAASYGVSRYLIDEAKYLLVFFYGNAGNAVTCDVVVDEETSLPVA